MNQTTFEELVKDSRLLNKDTLSELEQLLKEYPFCQTFHLLYTKNLYQEKHFRYNQQLKIAASIVGDRSRLKHYLEDVDATITIPPDLSPKENIEQQDDIKTTSPTLVDQVADEDRDAEVESMVLLTLDAKISREEKKKAIIALINKKFSERIDKKEDAKLIIPTVESEPQSEPAPKTEPESEHQPEPESEKEDIEYSIEQLPTSVETTETSSEVLIERFLRDAPRISRPNKEFYNPVNLAARSLQENEDFYTETYATICLKQGDVVKAIKIYEKLSLKLPEKSSYFASLIEKIKREQNI